MGGVVKSLSNPRTDKRLGSYNGHQSGNIERDRVVKKVGNFSPSGHYGKNVYADDGICPTLCSGSVVKNGLNIRESKPLSNPYTDKIERERDTIQLNNSHKTHQGGRIYSHNGLSITMNASGNNGWYTTDDTNEQKIRKRFSKDN